MRFEIMVANSERGINVHSGPSQSLEVIEWLAYTTTFVAVELNDGWYKREQDGWVANVKGEVQFIRDLDSRIVDRTDSSEVSEVDFIADASGYVDDPSNTVPTGGVVFNEYGGEPKNASSANNIANPVNDTPVANVTAYTGPVPWDDNFLKSEISKMRKNLSLIPDNYKDAKQELYLKFNRFKKTFPELYAGKTFSHVFFTRPDINILRNGEIDNALGTDGLLTSAFLNDEFANDPVFFSLFNHERKLLLSLTKHYTMSHDFNVYLSNAAESFEIPDEFIDTQEHGETLTGYKVKYGKHNIKSNTAGSFSVSYTDDKDVNIYRMHKAWIEYISRVYRGVSTPKRDYIKMRILDYACSVYYIICGPDGETILFWSKYFGVFPTSTPASAFSFSKGAGVKLPQYSINYDYAFKEDFDPLSLAEFNMNSRLELTYLKSYEPGLGTPGRTFTGAPFIETVVDPVTRQYNYKLRFRKDFVEGR